MINIFEVHDMLPIVTNLLSANVCLCIFSFLTCSSKFSIFLFFVTDIK